MFKWIFSHISMEWNPRKWAYFSLFLMGAISAFAMAMLLDHRDILLRHTNHESANMVWMVFLEEDADKELIERSIRGYPGISSIRLISKTEAYGAVQEDPLLSKSLTLAGRNPFPESFDVHWEPFYLREEFIDPTKNEVEKIAGVDRVGYDGARMKRLNLLQRLLYQMDLTLMAILWTLALLSLFLVGRVMFFPRGGIPEARFFLSLLVGFVGGAAGAFISDKLVATFFWRVLWSGPVAGLLFSLVHNVFEE